MIDVLQQHEAHVYKDGVTGVRFKEWAGTQAPKCAKRAVRHLVHIEGQISGSAKLCSCDT